MVRVEAIDLDDLDNPRTAMDTEIIEAFIGITMSITMLSKHRVPDSRSRQRSYAQQKHQASVIDGVQGRPSDLQAPECERAAAALQYQPESENAFLN